MPLAPGATLGPYTILSPLGAGGMGEVFRARDPRLGRDVALKVLPDAVARDPDRLARFEREARTVAGLNHPNIITLYSIEEDAGTRFLTMELVEGQGLDRVLVPGGLPVEKILDLAIPLSDALVAAHGKGVVHRDLKPANVMVSGDGRVKVLDFGLAKPAQSESRQDATQAMTLEAPLSSAGQLLGTVPYMAPEQVRGDAVDARTDVFAFGILVYELATGRRPFGGASLADVSSAVLRDTPRPLSSARADLPGELERIVGRCLEKSPRDRFQSASDLHSELRRLQRSLEGSSSTTAAPAADARPSIAVLPFNNMSADPENEYFSDGLTEELLNVLARIPELKVTGRTSSFAFKGKHEDLREIGQKLGVGTLLEGSVRKAGNRVRITAQLIKVSDGFHLWSDTYDRVLEDIFAVQDDIARSVSAVLQVTLLGKPAGPAKQNAECFELVLRANHLIRQNSEPAYTKAVALCRQAIEKCPDDARAWAAMAKAHVFAAFYGYADTFESHRAARRAAERALALDGGLSEAHLVMTWILGSLEFRWKDCLESARRAMALAPGASEPLWTVGVYEAAMGRFDEGLELVRKALEIDPLDPGAHVNHGRVRGWSGDLEGACESLRKALALSPEMVGGHSSLGLYYLRLGRAHDALEEIRKEVSAGYRDYSLSIAYHLTGKSAESDAALARAKTLGDQWGYQFASVHAVRGEIDDAFHWLDRSYELHDSGVLLTRVVPWFENLRHDPRWAKYLEKIGLPE